jgi:hypothetical protein
LKFIFILARALLFNARMYPQTLPATLSRIAAEVDAITDTLRGAILAIEVERASIGKSGPSCEEDLQAILGLGVLLGDLQEKRTRTETLSRNLPSPNKVSPKLAAKVNNLGKKLFETVSHIKNIQSEIYSLARLNLRAASHKLNVSEKSRAKKLAMV